MRKRSSIVLFLFLTIDMLIETSVEAASFITAEQAYPDARFPRFYGISGDGRVAVGESCPDVRPLFCEAFTWDRDRGLRPLGAFPVAVASHGVSADYDGSHVIGNSDSFGKGFGFRWDALAGMVSLDPLPTEYDDSLRRGSHATAISSDGATIAGFQLRGGLYFEDDFDEPRVRTYYSEDGTVIGGEHGELLHAITEAFVWTEGSGKRYLGTLALGDWGSEARAISSDGSIVVGMTDAVGRREAFVWDEMGGMRGLDVLPFDPDPAALSIDSAANAMSSDGSTIVGWSGYLRVDSDDFIHGAAFIYDRETGLRRIPGIEELWANSGATGVSHDGSIVVGFGSDSTGMRSDAFIWDAHAGVRPLKSYLESLGIELAGWRLTNAHSISEDGRTIVGDARDPFGRFQSFVAVIPEPGMPILVGLGLCLLAAFPIDGVRRLEDAASGRSNPRGQDSSRPKGKRSLFGYFRQIGYGRHPTESRFGPRLEIPGSSSPRRTR